MNRITRCTLLLTACGLSLLCLMRVTADEPPQTGPEIEKRFPPLKMPPGFKATLFACDPFIEYPSAIALGPRANSIFVAADYMTGLGTEIVRRDEIRLIEDTNGDGYADKSTIYADQFNSIMGLTFHGNTVYAMHSPYLTALRDTDGDGKADERRDLLSGLGLTPEENPVRLHCANGLVMGHDGWLYLALGDHGCKLKRPEGDELVLNGGGILRCRPDGRDLHVFATGLRNIYDVALDDELNVFVRDNENDGGDYKIRVCHSFFGADHGYPYLYYERPDEALPPIADLGLGSSAGGLCYLEQQFPAEYRGNLIFCEWGRSVVRYGLQRVGSSFATPKEIEFAAGAENDPYGFKPTDVVVERDGSLIVADWADGQRPKRGRARIYRIRYGDERADGVRPVSDDGKPSLGDWLKRLDSESHYERVQAQEAISGRGPEGLQALVEALMKNRLGVRGRLHAVWILARDGSRSSHETLFDLAKSDKNAQVQAQSVRALADLTDPVLIHDRLDAGRGDAETAARLAKLADDADSRVVLEVAVALGRMRWVEAPKWLRSTLTAPRLAKEWQGNLSPALAHAAMQSLRRSDNWPAVLKLLDLPNTEPIRKVALRAIANQAKPELVDGLIERLGDLELDPSRRREYADALTRVYKQPSPWVYWGYRPPPRPANAVEWKRTAPIEQTLDHLLADPDATVRLATLRQMQHEKIPTQLATLQQWLGSKREPDGVAAILESLRDHPADKLRDLLARVVADPKHAPPNRSTALSLLASGLDEANAGRLLELASAVEEGSVLAELLRQLHQRPLLNAVPLLVAKLNSSHPEVRTAAIEGLTARRVTEAGEPVRKLLDDKEATVRRAAASAVGQLGVRSAVDPLLRLAVDADPTVRRASFDSLRLLGETRAVPLAIAALSDRETQTAALGCIAELGGPVQAQIVIDLANRDPSAEVVTLAVRSLTKWKTGSELPASRRLEWERAVAELQGRSAMLVLWHARGPLKESDAPPVLKQVTALDQSTQASPGRLPDWRALFATGLEARVNLANKSATGVAPATGAVQGDGVWLASTDLIVSEPTPVQFLASATGKLQVWLNGQRVHQRDKAGAFQLDSERFDGTLNAGKNRLVVQVASSPDSAEYHVRFRRKSSTAEHEALIQAALTRTGNADRGRIVFLDTTKAQCSKCHRIGDKGERIGPELTGIGDRFSRIHIVESILEPSRTVTPGYQTIVVVLRDGKVLTGIKVAETETTLTLGDNQGQKHTIAKAEIEEQKTQSQSTMPDGIVKQLTVDQFVDLIAFLSSQKDSRGKKPAPATP
ncbi:MAG: HEAT repeat domain-containing protein [Planctomycetales bacterium]|nr:HEAT repeat domain-containing protein [Planctomycetales bacterium]